MYPSMAATHPAGGSRTAFFSLWRASSGKNPPAASVQEAEVGVKWNVRSGRPFSHPRTPADLCGGTLPGMTCTGVPGAVPPATWPGKAGNSAGRCRPAVRPVTWPANGARGVAVGHVCDRANTGEMNRHLADISAAVAPGRHAALVLDGAGWHRSRDLKIPDSVSLLRLPPYSPEPSPMENVFSFIKGNYLSNRVFPTVSDVRQALGRSWDLFIGGPGRIRSIVTRAYASAFTQASVAEDVQQVKT